MNTLWLLALLFLCGTFASAQDQELPDTTGNAFLRECSALDKESPTPLDAVKMSLCGAYVKGFVVGVDYGLGYVDGMTGMKPLVAPFCLPKGVEVGQMVRVVSKYIRAHPEDANKDTALLIMAAFRNAYPCSNK